MFSNLRSLIFKLDPETAHSLAIKSLKFNFVPKILEEEKNSSLFKLGFGFVEVGTITPLKQYGNPKPRIFRLVEDEALINRLGFNNLGAKNIVNRIRKNNPIGLLGINIGPNKDTKDKLSD